MLTEADATTDFEDSTFPITSTFGSPLSPAEMSTTIGSPSNTPTSPAPTTTPLISPPTTSTLANTEDMFMEITTGDREPNLPLYTPPSNYQYGGQIAKPQIVYGQSWQESAVPQSETPAYTNFAPVSFVKPNFTGSNLYTSSYPSVSYFGYNSQSQQQQPQNIQPSYTYAQGPGPNFVSESRPAYGQSSYQHQEIKPYRPHNVASAQYPERPNQVQIQVESPYKERPPPKHQSSNSYGPPNQEQTAPFIYDWHPPQSPPSYAQSQETSPWQQSKPVQQQEIQTTSGQKPQFDFVAQAKPVQNNYYPSQSIENRQPVRDDYSPLRPTAPTRVPLIQQGYNSPYSISAENSGYQSNFQQSNFPLSGHAQPQPSGQNFQQQDAPQSSSAISQQPPFTLQSQQNYANQDLQYQHASQQYQGTNNYGQASQSFVQPQSPHLSQRPSYGQSTSFVYGNQPSNIQLQPPTSYQPSLVSPLESQEKPSLADELPGSQPVPPLLLDQQNGGHNQAAATDQTETNAISQCDQVVKVASDRTEEIELVIPAGQCNIKIEAPKGRLTLQLKNIMIACEDQQAITVYEGGSAFPLARLCGQVAETPLYLLDGSAARLVVQSRGVKFTFTSFLW